MVDYPRFSSLLGSRLIARARRSSLADPSVEFPAPYLVHAHFLPGGYLSPPGAWLYDHWVRPTYGLWRAGSVDRRLARTIARAHPGASVLEVACGPGRLLAELAAQPGLQVTGVDLSPLLLERAQRRLERHAVAATLAHGDAAALEFDSGTFDVAVASHFLGHLSEARAVEAIQEIVRVLRPGGRLYLIEHRWHPVVTGGMGVLRDSPIAGLPLQLRVLEAPVA